MKFNAAAFDRHLANIGQDVLWRRSYACACVNPASGQPDPKHALCLGKGRLWDAPVRTVVGVSHQEVNAELAPMGLWESGDLSLSIPQYSGLWDAGQYDRVTMLNATTVFSQPLTRGAPSERLLFQPKIISRVFWLHPQTRAVVEGGIPVVDNSGMLSWPGVGEPPAGTTYSITGEKFDEYFVWMAFPSDRNMHQGMRLPKKAVVRRFDLFSR
jgi:hypothetical protein